MAKANIMIVEDDAITAIDIENQLKNLGYGITAIASYGKDAIQKVKENTPDLVLMDIVLKGEIDGIEAAEEIRNLIDIPVIFLTAFADKKKLKRAKLTNPFGYILKPFNEKDLEVTIDMALYVAKVDAERKLAEEALRKEKDTAQQYLDLAGVIFVAINRKGEVTLINQKGCEILGYNEEEIVGKNWFDNFIPKWLREDLIPVSKRLLNGNLETAKYHENPILTKKGEERIIAWHNTILKDDKGNVIGHLSSGEDITVRKSAEKALEESEAVQRTLIESLPVGVIIVDPVTRFIERVNRATELLFGASKEHIEGNRCHKFICPASEGACPICDLGQEVDNSDREIICADGSRLPVLKSVKRIQIQGQDKLLECFVDITERKWAEKALRDSEARLEALSDASFEAIFLSDQGICLDQNNAAERLFGYTLAEAIGRHGMEWIVPEDREQVKNNMLAGYEKPFEVTALRKNGTTFPCKIQARMIEYQDRSIRVIALRDITERKRVEEDLRKEREKFRIGVEEFPLGVSLIEKSGKYKYVNPKFEEIFGYTLEDIPSGREWFRKAYPDPEYKKQVISTWINDQQAAGIRENRQRIFTVTCKNGSEKSIHFFPMTIETGDQLVIYEDVTNQK